MIDPTVRETVVWALAGLTAASAAYVVWTQNLVRAGFALMYTLFGVAGLYATLAADFLAAVQLLLYIGGILVLLLFGIMFTRRVYEVKISIEPFRRLPGVVVALGLLGILTATVARVAPLLERAPQSDAPQTAALGNLLLSKYLLPFELVSVLLLAALIGAVVLARREVRR
ncbi:MAG: NADH-quinone oxidoreductase subunit J [Myxococcales bacterium]|nr:NADH-quinone oxidoreductase subunit J [Myxococcales bacterium]